MMTGTDLQALPVDRALNIVEHLFEESVLEEKEIRDARDKVRAQMREVFRLPEPTKWAVGSGTRSNGLSAGEVDEYGRTVPQRRAPGPRTKPTLPALIPSDDPNNPFPGLEGPVL